MSQLKQLEQALLAIKDGYEVRELTMLDDEMVEHVETVVGEHDLLLTLVRQELHRQTQNPNKETQA